MNAIDKLKKAKITLLIEQPWFGQLVTFLNFISADKIGIAETECETMGVDINGNVFYNEKFIESLKINEIKTVLCHEILHLVFLHPNRCGTRHPLLYNIAADLKVNNELIYVRDSKGNLLFELPSGCLIPYGNCFKMNGVTVNNISEKTTEMIYEELFQQDFDPSGKQFDALVQGNNEKKDPNGNNNNKGISNKENEWKERAYVANATCKDKGTVPAGVLREYELLDNAELSWKKIIRQRLKSIYKKVTWSRVNKKFFPDYYFPGTKKVPGLICVVAIDTSGSMTKKELSKAMSEVWNLSRQYEKITFYVMPCDSEIENVIEVNTKNRKKLYNIRLGGGGGTNFVPVFKEIKKNYKDKIDCLIYFTDLYGDFPRESGHYQTYWITHTREVDVPFGRIIHLKNN